MSSLLSFHWTVLNGMATADCKRDWEVNSSYVQRRERMIFGKELAVSAIICPYSYQLSVFTLLPTHRTHLLPKGISPKFYSVIAFISKFRISG